MPFCFGRKNILNSWPYKKMFHRDIFNLSNLLLFHCPFTSLCFSYHWTLPLSSWRVWGCRGQPPSCPSSCPQGQSQQVLKYVWLHWVPRWCSNPKTQVKIILISNCYKTSCILWSHFKTNHIIQFKTFLHNTKDRETSHKIGVECHLRFNIHKIKANFCFN